MGTGIGGHSKPHHGHTDEWLTPPSMINRLGPFELDPCSPVSRPWDTAKQHYTIIEDGLAQEWRGLVWMNPPYAKVEEWMDRLSTYGNGLALVFARTETEWFQTMVFQRASAVFFLKGRIYFHYPNGERAKHNSGAPSAIVAYGDIAMERIRVAKYPGHFVNLRGTQCKP